MVSPEELITLLEQRGHGAVPSEQAAIAQTIQQIRTRQVNANRFSGTSTFLRRVAWDNIEICGPKAVQALQEVEILGVELPYVNAFPYDKDHKWILVFRGLLQHIVFFGSLIKIA